MNSFLDGLQSVLGVFVQSDLYGPPPPVWYIAMTGQAAHFLIGTALAFFRAKPLWVALVGAAWIAKELLGDIPNSGGAALVWLDSVADLGFAALGFWMVRKRNSPMKPDAKAQQTVRVERVDVHEGGRAIVGAVQTGRRDDGEM